VNNSSLQTPDPAARVLAVVGPTAAGKTALSEELAARLGGEIVSADSMQVYRGMDIGTAKQPAQLRRVRYHCLDLARPDASFSAALYQTAARAAIADCTARGVLPVVCGGTGLYVRAALDDFSFPAGEQDANPLRGHFEGIAESLGAEALHTLLATRDPESAALIHPNNVRRVVRALEMAESGTSYAIQHEGFSERTSVYDTAFLGVTVERAELYRRIDARVDTMLAAGLIAEVQELLDAGFRAALTAAQAIGYKEIVAALDGTCSLEAAADDIKRASRRYAKRQLTWFHADPRITWVDVTDLSLAQAAEEALAALRWSEARR